MIMASFAMSSYTQTFDCLHENPASLLETREEFCVECSLEAEGSSIEAALELHADLRCEQENEPAQSLDVTNDDGFGHKWTNRDGELKEQVYDIGNRLPSWLFLGQHIYPLLEQDELDAYLALPSTDVICISCHLQINRFVGCLEH